MDKATQNPLQIIINAGYSKKIASLLHEPSNLGAMANPDITARHTSDCGDELILYVKLDTQKILDAKYEYIGCRGLEAAAAGVTEMIKGKTLQEAENITCVDVLTYLEEMPPSKYECIHLALKTLKKGTRAFNKEMSSQEDTHESFVRFEHPTL